MCADSNSRFERIMPRARPRLTFSFFCCLLRDYALTLRGLRKKFIKIFFMRDDPRFRKNFLWSSDVLRYPAQMPFSGYPLQSKSMIFLKICASLRKVKKAPTPIYDFIENRIRGGAPNRAKLDVAQACAGLRRFSDYS